MTFSRLHQIVTYLLAGLGLFSLSLGSELSPTVLALIAVAYVGSAFVPPRVLDRPGYTRTWNGLVVGFLAVQVFRGFAGAPPITLGLEFGAFLQISRLFHRRTARDHQHVQALAFLHLIAATILSTGLDYGVAFFGFVIVLPWMLALSHLRTEIEGHYAGPEQDAAFAEGEEIPKVVRSVLASRRIVGPGFLVGTAALSVPLFFVTAAFFLLFPRVGMGFLSFELDPGRRVAGFGNNVQLGGFGTIRTDPTVVLRVLVPGSNGESRTFRMRGTSFDRYEDASWTRGFQTPPEPMAQRYGYFPVVREPTGEPDELRLSLILDPLEEPVVFLPEGTIALKTQPRVENSVDVERQLSLSPGLDIRYEDPDGLEFRYTAVLAPDARGRLFASLTADERSRYLQLPPGMERIGALARRIGLTGTEAERAQRLLTWLRSAEFSYSLEQPDPHGRDPLEVFLFEARRGHCEYFSSALAVMARTLGIPSRNVTGFLGGEYNTYGRYYAIRQGDAHSWVELYIDGAWVTYDPTPPARDAIAVDTSALAEVRAMLDALRTRWSEDVVGYDLRRQVDGLRRFFRWFRDVRGPRTEPSTPASESTFRRDRQARWWPYVAGMLILVVGFLLLRRRRTRRRRDGEAVRLYRLMERKLARRGLGRPPSTTPAEFARELAEQAHPTAPTVAEVTEAYTRWRFAPQPIDADRVAELRRKVRDL